ncbi:hypothetical protein DFS34DRAFT_696177 [Phlyctochytrium arcticum]|nr:hypothetical protein DFS34DRAFT_696177 [Phlyctochytrium arcticum]
MAVVHGETPAPGLSTPFKILGFEEGDQEWNDFCCENMYGNSRGTPSPYDIVIGPMCYPDPQTQQLVARCSPEKLVQVAFKSQRAMDYCGSCVTCVFEEKQPPLVSTGTFLS